jgi:hypothetical protein
MSGDFPLRQLVRVVVDEDGALFEDTVEGIMVTLGEPDEVLGTIVAVLAVEVVTLEGFALFVARSRTMKSGTDKEVHKGMSIGITQTQIIV